MFDLQCMQYLKGLQENPENSQLRSQFYELLQSNKDKIDNFIVQFQLSPEQKQLLMEVMQESSSKNSNTKFNNSVHDLNNESNSSTESFYDTTIEYFKEWRDEYFKLRGVNPKCIEIVDNYIQSCLMKQDQYDEVVFENFKSLPSQQNDAFLKFKNHVTNIIIANLIDRLNQEITVVKTSTIPFLKKYKLLFEIERVQKKISKRSIILLRYREVLDESKKIRGVN